ncbi:glycoside hydrolase family 9 protein [Leptothoe sp. PORK10 BA2]|uniref:glycoside hydrolase family 9 protein n=1 Tax=Leptothoe sp. PORK10 BA2 TaxID=3110254 RepID=UPI002B1EDD4E|nr:glycoside hydrolase family 9 protein [Leptothoe sp. PORK10 BA2]MEA5464964.1 glycoside hydrolase family 9 protein [Leptothoe sp. PORK10 BA2]
MQTTFEVSQDWGDGLVGFVTVKNNGSTVLEKWDLIIETTFDIETLWGGDILEQVGNRYTVGSKGWNARLDPGESAKFGFVGRNAAADGHQVTVVPKPLFEPSVPEPTVLATNDLKTTFEVSEDWGHGLVGFVHVENTGLHVLDDWVFTIKTTFDIDTLWGGEILERKGHLYTVRANGWNSRLDPGEKTKFGFVGRNATAATHQVTVVAAPSFHSPASEPIAVVPGQGPLAEVDAVDFKIVHDWWGGFTGQLSFTYSGTEPLETWQLRFESPFEISELWHGEIVDHRVEQNIHVYTVSNASWNGILLKGDTITIGLNGKGSSAHEPIHYYFNDLFVGNASDESVMLELPIPPAAPGQESGAGQSPVPASPVPAPPVPAPPDPVVAVPAVDDPPLITDPGLESSEEPVSNPLPGEESEPEVVEAPVLEEPTLTVPTVPIEIPVVAPVEIPVEVPVMEQPSPEPGSVPGEPTTSEGDGSLYGETLQKSLLFYEAQRSGDLPDDNRIAWRGDSALQDGADVGVDLTGGYYDAGDHVKFGLPMAASITMLSWGAIEYQAAYQQSGQYDELLAAIKWGTDYFLKAHISDGQSTQAFYGQVGDPGTDHEYWGAPEDLTIHRPAYKIDPENPGSDLAAETAAALASASIIFRSVDPTYAAELLVNAQQLYAFADSYRGRYSDSIPEVQQYYNSWSGYTDELAWGAAWLYKATGEQSYLAQAQANYQNLGIDWTQSWDDKSYGTGVLLAQITDGANYRSEVEAWLDSWLSGGIEQTEGGLAWLDPWGALRYSANTAFLAGLYSDTVNFDEGQYDQFSRRQIDYILGDNPAQQSYVAGVGDSFPEYIHHRGASGTTDINAVVPNENVLYGALVGGPRLPHDFSYVDERTDFLGNEVALDYNAGFTGAVARLYGQDGGPLLSDAALIALSETGLSETGSSETVLSEVA